eukprot:11214266-Lingulodinium_polyedra.AAC.1
MAAQRLRAAWQEETGWVAARGQRNHHARRLPLGPPLRWSATPSTLHGGWTRPPRPASGRWR